MAPKLPELPESEVTWHFPEDKDCPLHNPNEPQPFIRDASGNRIQAKLTYLFPENLPLLPDAPISPAALVELNPRPHPNWSKIQVQMYGQMYGSTDGSATDAVPIIIGGKVLPDSDGTLFFLFDNMKFPTGKSDVAMYDIWFKVVVWSYKKDKNDVSPSFPPEELWPGQKIPEDKTGYEKNGYVAGALKVHTRRKVARKMGAPEAERKQYKVGPEVFAYVKDIQDHGKDPWTV